MKTRRFIRKRLTQSYEDDGRTLQSQTASTDINLLLKSYEKTGTFTHVAKQMPTYGDFSSATDYLSSVLQVKAAEDLFLEYPAELRARFKNDPHEFLEFMADPNTTDEQIELGLAEAPETPEKPTPTPVTDTDTPDAV